MQLLPAVSSGTASGVSTGEAFKLTGGGRLSSPAIVMVPDGVIVEPVRAPQRGQAAASDAKAQSLSAFWQFSAGRGGRGQHRGAQDQGAHGPA